MSERAIKLLQKEVLSEFEENLIEAMSPERFNALRKLIFRSTFHAYRLGHNGIRESDPGLLKLIDAATEAMDPEQSVLQELPLTLQQEVLEYCLYVWLEAYRIGARAEGAVT